MYVLAATADYEDELQFAIEESHGPGDGGILDKTWQRLAVYSQLDRCEGAFYVVRLLTLSGEAAPNQYF